MTIAAVAISSIVVLLTLGKITRQLARITALLQDVGKELSVDKGKEDRTSAEIHHRIDNLETQLKAKKGDVDWKG